MGSLLNCFASFDQFAINFLKAKQLKTFPGGVFSIIITIVNIGVLAGCLVFYFFQSSRMSLHYQSSQFNSDIPAFNAKESTINISLSHYGKPITSEQIDSINSYFKVVVLSRNETKISGNLINHEIINNTIHFSIASSVLNFNLTEVNFPRISILSCATLQSLLTMDYFVFSKDDKEEIEKCKNDIQTFYGLNYIVNEIFIFKMITTQYQITKDYKLKSSIKTNSFLFSFDHKAHEVFVTEKKKMAVLFDNSLFVSNKEYDFYINWVNPSKTIIQQFEDNFDLQLIVSEKNKYEIMTYKIYKVAFLGILPWIGSFSRFISCLSAIPALWYGYYTSKSIAKMYYLNNGIDPKEDTNAFDWDNMSYCQWVKMKFRCGAHAKKLNNEIVKMRKDVAEHYENLYKKKVDDIRNSTVDFLSINEMD